MKETEQARTRRRWITLGEVVGIAALAISGLSYWDSHQERVVAAKAKPAATRAGPLLLTGTLADGGARIDLKPATGGVIQTQTIRFPTAVRADPVETTGNARIEAAWFDTGLRAALKGRKVHSGRHRLAVGIATTYVSNGVSTTDRAVYDLGYALHTRVLRPDAVVIEGVSFVRRVSGDLIVPVDARFVESLGPAE
jgi:hypothetical protein